MQSNFDYLGNNRSPIPGQHFIWYGIYNDGSKIYEFNNDQTETEFNDINKPELSQFGLIGMGGKVYFNTNDGLIHLDTVRVLKLSLEDENGKSYNITEIKDKKYTDIIQYKKGYMDFRPGRMVQNGTITPSEHYFGFKTDVELPDNIIKVQIIYCLPLRGTIYLITKLNSIDKDFKGKLIAQYGGNVETTDLDISKNTNNEFRIYGL